MQDTSNASLWDLAYGLDPTDEAVCNDIDEPLSNKLEDMDNLLEIYYYLCYGDMHLLLPKTRKKINTLLRGEFTSGKETNWWQFKNFSSWLDEDLQKELTLEWLDNDEVVLDGAWMVSSLGNDADTSLKILSKLTRLYKNKKSSENAKLMEKIFVDFDSARIGEACEIISKSTPVIVASLLQRNDIPDKYTIRGLKAISKLSKQRDINIQIDFDMLKHLGPKGRLDAMKQLMGMFDKYYQFKKNQPAISSYSLEWTERKLKKNAKEFKLPFKDVPTREDIEVFLFPCSLKYNDEVVSMIERFDEFINKGDK